MLIVISEEGETVGYSEEHPEVSFGTNNNLIQIGKIDFTPGTYDTLNEAYREKKKFILVSDTFYTTLAHIRYLRWFPEEQNMKSVRFRSGEFSTRDQDLHFFS